MFSEIIGQENVTAHLQNALRTGNISHAYLIHGGKGSGKKMLAKTFAQTMLCRDVRMTEAGPEPCGVCPSCIKALSDSHPDIRTVTHEKPASIGVEEIRVLRQDVQVLPYESARKVYLIPEAEKLTAQAQNALLKTLEEPPSYAVLILLADDTAAFLPTVLSRSILLRTRPLEAGQVLEYLREKRPDLAERYLPLYASLSGGNIGRAIALADSETFTGFCGKLLRILQNVPGTDIHTFLSFLREEDTDTDAMLDILQIWYRDTAVYKRTGDADALIFREEIQYISQCAAALSYAGLERIFAAILRAIQQLKANGNTELILEMLFVGIREQYKNRAGH